jgi:hypothetical protein
VTFTLSPASNWLDRQLLADLVAVRDSTRNSRSVARREVEARLRRVPSLGLRRRLAICAPKPSCSACSRPALRLDLHDRARPRLDDRDRHRGAGVIEDLGHAQLASFRHPMIPAISGAASVHLDLDVDAGRQIQLRQRVDRLRPGIDDVDHPLVRLQLELLAALLVDVRRAQHRPALARVGSGIGPRTVAPVFSAVRTMSDAV